MKVQVIKVICSSGNDHGDHVSGTIMELKM